MSWEKAVAVDLGEILERIGQGIKKEHTDYDEHCADPRWEWYARLHALKLEMEEG